MSESDGSTQGPGSAVLADDDSASTHAEETVSDASKSAVKPKLVQRSKSKKGAKSRRKSGKEAAPAAVAGEGDDVTDDKPTKRRKSKGNDGKPAKPKKSFAEGAQRGITAREAKMMAGVYIASIVIHFAILAILGYVQFQEEIQEALSSITSALNEPEEDVEEPIEVVETEEPVELEDDAIEADESAIDPIEEPIEEPIVMDVPEPEPPAAPPVEVNESLPDPSRKIENQGDLAGRSTVQAREAMRDKYGGTGETDAAVFTGLAWLAKQQREDGSWSFASAGQGAKAGGLKDCPTGATGMVLLAYLGAGQTHLKGKYKQVVYDGLVFLIKHAESKVSNNMADLRSGSPNHVKMYAHCIATLALCEAYALCKGELKGGLPSDDESKERDKPKTAAERKKEATLVRQLRLFEQKLKAAAQLSTNYLMAAQNKDGGWRYEPNKGGGDTSVTGWAVMALHSAYVGGLSVSPNYFRQANFYLTRVSFDNGAKYGYTGPDANRSHSATSAVGLLCRVYLNRTHKGIPLGVDYLSAVGPTINNMYYNYYATQVMHHWGGEKWEEWNLRNREQLVKSQRKSGPASGSWPVTGGHAALGGDIMQTCLCVMTLEVYYRHLPIYRRRKERTDI